MVPFGGFVEQSRYSDALLHHEAGQNVLFVDSHVEFSKRAYCGVENENIYLVSGDPNRGLPIGYPPLLVESRNSEKDSVLVHDPPGLFEMVTRPSRP
jgi:prepilin-type processing-associated H-X9-DG protein